MDCCKIDESTKLKYLYTCECVAHNKYTIRVCKQIKIKLTLLFLLLLVCIYSQFSSTNMYTPKISIECLTFIAHEFNFKVDIED